MLRSRCSHVLISMITPYQCKVEMLSCSNLNDNSLSMLKVEMLSCSNLNDSSLSMQIGGALMF
jgi:hypothetical protein